MSIQNERPGLGFDADLLASRYCGGPWDFDSAAAWKMVKRCHAFNANSVYNNPPTGCGPRPSLMSTVFILPPMLGCGPGAGFVYVICGGAGAIIGTFMWGAISLFTGGKTLGVTLITLSACMGAVAMRCLGFF